MLIQQTRLSPKHLQHGLAVLIKQNLAYHFHDELSSSTFYEANIQAAYFLIRTGKVLELIDARYGEVAREFTKIIMLLGHAKVSDIVEEYEKQQQEKLEQERFETEAEDEEAHGDEQQNGSSKEHSTNVVNVNKNGGVDDDWHTSGKMDEALWDLLAAGYLEPVFKNMFHSPTDTYNVVEKELLDRDYGGSLKGTKQKDEIKSHIRERLRDLRSEGREVPLPKGKRPNGDHTNGDKRRRLTNGHATNGTNGTKQDNVEKLDVGISKVERHAGYIC